MRRAGHGVATRRGSAKPIDLSVIARPAHNRNFARCDFGLAIILPEIAKNLIDDKDLTEEEKRLLKIAHAALDGKTPSSEDPRGAMHFLSEFIRKRAGERVYENLLSQLMRGYEDANRKITQLNEQAFEIKAQKIDLETKLELGQKSFLKSELSAVEASLAEIGFKLKRLENDRQSYHIVLVSVWRLQRSQDLWDKNDHRAAALVQKLGEEDLTAADGVFLQRYSDRFFQSARADIASSHSTKLELLS